MVVCSLLLHIHLIILDHQLFLMEFGSEKRTGSIAQMGKEVNQIKIIGSDSSIRVTTVKPKKYQSALQLHYSVSKYNLCQNYMFPEELLELIPKNTPIYVEHG